MNKSFRDRAVPELSTSLGRSYTSSRNAKYATDEDEPGSSRRMKSPKRTERNSAKGAKHAKAQETSMSSTAKAKAKRQAITEVLFFSCVGECLTLRFYSLISLLSLTYACRLLG